MMETKNYTTDGKLKWIVAPHDEKTILQKYPNAIVLGYNVSEQVKDHWTANYRYGIKVDNDGYWYAIPLSDFSVGSRDNVGTVKVVEDDFIERVKQEAWSKDSQ